MTNKTTVKFIKSRGFIELIILTIFLIFVAISLKFMTTMPGRSYSETKLPLSSKELSLKQDLKRHVRVLAQDIGERNLSHYPALIQAQNYIKSEFRAYGYSPREYSFDAFGSTVRNIEVNITGTTFPKELVVIAAHYDSVEGSPGADDNASGVACLLAIAKSLSLYRSDRSLKLVAFVNEEPPYFKTEHMGSYKYALNLKKTSANIVGMISLESMGYFTEDTDSQSYPFILSPYYPSKGNFIGFVSNIKSRLWLKDIITEFRKHAKVPSEGFWGPEWIQGVDWSDHWSFWQIGVPAMMITDTVPFRNPYYHQSSDTVETLHYDDFTRTVSALIPVVKKILQAQ